MDPGRNVLPPSRIAEPPSVHLSHVAHTNDPDDEVIRAHEICGRHPLEISVKYQDEY